MLRRLRLFLRPQPAACSNCALVIRERIRRPCSRCGDYRRTLSRGLYVAVESKDTLT